MAISTHPRIGINGQLLSGAQSYRSAGVSGYIRQLLAHLPAAAPDWQLTAFVPPAAPELPAGLSVQRSRRWDTGRPVRRILWEQLVLPALSRRLGLDLLHATVNVSPWIGGCPAVVTVHDLSFLRYPEAFPTLQRIYLRSQARRSVLAARQVIAVSEATAQDVIRFFAVPAGRISVVYNGVDAAFHPAPQAEVEAFRRRKKLPARFIMHLGTLEPRKNLVRLVQAFAQVLRQDREKPGREPLKLLLAGGKGWDYDNIFRAVADLGLTGEVLFPGYVPDEELVWWYRAAILFAYPSLFEGFGLPVAEAMACGTPAVTSSVSSLPEVAGDAALLVDPTSVEALAGALRQLLDNPALARQFGERGKAQAARFSWSRTARETVQVYRAALKPPAVSDPPSYPANERNPS